MPHNPHPCPFCKQPFAYAEARIGASKGDTHCPHCGKRTVWYLGFTWGDYEHKTYGWAKPTPLPRIKNGRLTYKQEP